MGLATEFKQCAGAQRASKKAKKSGRSTAGRVGNRIEMPKLYLPDFDFRSEDFVTAAVPLESSIAA